MSGTALTANINLLSTQLLTATQPTSGASPSPLPFLSYLYTLQSEALLAQLLGQPEATKQLNRINSLANELGFNSDLIPDIPFGNLGNYTIRFGYTTNTINLPLTPSGEGQDAVVSLTAPVMDKVITGLGGDDLLGSVGRGSVLLDAGKGNDIFANIGLGNNTLLGNIGNDFLLNVGGYADGTTLGLHVLKGGSGNDTLVNLAAGDSNLSGGDGDDLIINYGLGKSTLQGNNGNDILINLADAATLNGGNGDDQLYGAEGNDILSGGAGFDRLSGGDGDDNLTGGLNSDVLTGGNGADRFILSYKLAPGLPPAFVSSGVDTLTDFNAAELDVIRIDVDASQKIALGASLSFDAATSELKINGDIIAILAGVTSFNTSTVVLF